MDTELRGSGKDAFDIIFTDRSDCENADYLDWSWRLTNAIDAETPLVGQISGRENGCGLG